MDVRFVRTLIYIFSGLIAVFSLLMLVNYLGGLAGPRSGPSGKDGSLPVSAEIMAQRALTAARFSGGARGPMLPSSRQAIFTSTANSGGVGLVVKESNFSGVAEAPRGMMDILSEMGGGDKRKPSPIALDEDDLDKTISVGSDPGKGTKLSSRGVPELGRRSGQEGITLLSAPVDYKLFRSSETWWAFANSRKLKSGPHDFSAADLVILISLSDFPSGIFSITGVEAGRRETVVKYRVDPMNMSAETPKERREAYARAPVPKGLPVRLEQVP